MNEILEAALVYCQKGFSVIPIDEHWNEEEQKFDKKPYVKWQGFQTKFPTETEIKRWWTKWPGAMIGIVTGCISKVSVIDCDSPEAYDFIQTQLPDTFITPIATTPRGGKHIWYSSNGSRIINKSAVFENVDSRGDGGYIVAPPSKNEHGGLYQWLEGLALHEVAPQGLPSNILKSFLYIEGCSNSVVNDTTQDNNYYKILQKGHRDQDLFKIGMALADGRCPQWMLSQVLNLLALGSSPPFPEKEVEIKIKSICERLARKERNLSEEVREWCLLQECYFNTTLIRHELQITTKSEIKNLTVILNRLQAEGIIERYGEKRGEYRTKVIDKQEMDLITEDEIQDVNVKLPIDLNDMCVISPGNIIVVAGSKSSGKTAFLMNVALMNQNAFDIVYLNSEMHQTEFKKRMKAFGYSLDQWKIKGYKCHSNFEDYIDGDRKKIFIVDYLEVHDKFFEIAKPIRKIHEKLGDSLCFIGVQMKAGAELGRGGDFSAEKARLYLSMDYNVDEKMTKVTIYDAKEPRPPHDNVRGKFRRIKIINGSKISPFDNWKWPNK